MKNEKVKTNSETKAKQEKEKERRNGLMKNEKVKTNTETKAKQEKEKEKRRDQKKTEVVKNGVKEHVLDKMVINTGQGAPVKLTPIILKMLADHKSQNIGATYKLWTDFSKGEYPPKGDPCYARLSALAAITDFPDIVKYQVCMCLSELSRV